MPGGALQAADAGELAGGDPGEASGAAAGGDGDEPLRAERWEAEAGEWVRRAMGYLGGRRVTEWEARCLARWRGAGVSSGINMKSQSVWEALNLKVVHIVGRTPTHRYALE